VTDYQPEAKGAKSRSRKAAGGKQGPPTKVLQPIVPLAETTVSASYWDWLTSFPLSLLGYTTSNESATPEQSAVVFSNTEPLTAVADSTRVARAEPKAGGLPPADKKQPPSKIQPAPKRVPDPNPTKPKPRAQRMDPSGTNRVPVEKEVKTPVSMPQPVRQDPETSQQATAKTKTETAANGGKTAQERKIEDRIRIDQERKIEEERREIELRTALTDAGQVVAELQRRTLKVGSLATLLQKLNTAVKKKADWTQIKSQLEEVKETSASMSLAIPTVETAAAGLYVTTGEQKGVADVRSMCAQASEHRIKPALTRGPLETLKQIDLVLEEDPAGHTRARSLARNLVKMVGATTLKEDVERAERCLVDLPEVKELVKNANKAANVAMDPQTQPALPASSKTKYHLDYMNQYLAQAVKAEKHDWPTIEAAVRLARWYCKRVHDEIAIAPQRQNDMVGGDDKPLEIRTLKGISGDGHDGEETAIRDALAGIRGTPLEDGQVRWQGGGGKWGEDHGNYAGGSYGGGVHTGPLPPLPFPARYLEYYVRHCEGARDLRRIVRSRVDDRIWYTWDHYSSFVLLDET